ncbi:hypothetical protein QA645_41165 [Bradyrhizobium sp. CIAT3101]|uniref:hypothetical protein n=1 Tax=Bradyrhizobium sp. CIAT3101 TaxID=439387 RepID=UPI0024B117F7|nr:hypothetical protein [Bradyrhizobium sp. CIAT3101]WFU80757.1 hypothetical protein QA645_41165 [Bradyrhizobium sp. CIAT3101]
MAGKMNFSGPFGNWEELDSSDRGIDSAVPLSKPQRVAPEDDVLKRKFATDSSKTYRADPGQSQISESEHSILIRAKKKGTKDTDVNAKTFVISGNKIVGTQG